MKTRISLILTVSVMLLLMVFCRSGKTGDKTNTPEYVTDKFLFHLNKLEFEEAKQYGTESTVNMLSLLASLVAFVDDQGPPEPVSVVISHCDIQDNIAVCHYTSNGKADKIELLKINDKWLVNLEKESFAPPKINAE